LAVAVRDDGRLILVEPATGREIRTLAEEGSPTDPPSEGGRSDIARAALASDGATVYFATCCEPASGAVWTVPAAGGEPTYIADGSSVAVRSDGALAIADPSFGIKRFSPTPPDQLLGRADLIPLEPPADGGRLEDPETIADVAWSPSGDLLAVGLDHGGAAPRIATVSLADSAPSWHVLTPSRGAAWRSPRFGPGGHLYVIESRAGAGAVLRILDLDGRDLGTVDLAGRAPSAIAADRTSAWLLVAPADGGLLIVDPDGVPGPAHHSGSFASIDW
jgi:hypothetical protein